MNEEIASQRMQIYEALLNGDRLTGLIAMQRFRCMRLGARIHELIKQGVPIESRYITVTDITGKEKRVKEYWVEFTEWEFWLQQEGIA